MDSRIIESRKSRLVTILINPIISCSARLHFYLVMIGALFPLKDSVRATYRPEVIGDLGGFGGLFALNSGKYNCWKTIKILSSVSFLLCPTVRR